MAGIFFVDAIRRAIHERARKKRVQFARSWPQVSAQVNTWKIVPAGDAAQSFTQTDVIEAGFHFMLNNDYYGGYLRSIPMTRREAERLAVGSPTVNVRYNPENPDIVAVLAEDNARTFPFELVSE